MARAGKRSETRNTAPVAPQTRRYIVSWAQTKTPVFKPFLEALKQYRRHTGAELKIVRGVYKNPTSIYSEADSEDWYAPEVVRYLVDAREQLCPNLCLYADVPTQPTASRPLSGFEVFCGKNSGIFGHPKRALEVVATARRTPRLLATTGAVTVPNYTDSKAGKKGDAHHVYGALVVEVEDSGVYHMRHVSATHDGSFIDLDREYHVGGSRKAPPAAALSLGDLHAVRPCPPVMKATEELVDLVQPEVVVVHDALDFRARNHHDRTLRRNLQKHELGQENVRDEVEQTVDVLNDLASWLKRNARVVVARSNHCESLDRWLQECNPHTDLVNARYYFALWNRLLDACPPGGEVPDAFPLEAERIGVDSRVSFLKRNEEFSILGTAFNFHGDKGTNGSRGTPHQYARLGTKTVTGHTHTPGIRDGNFTAGVTADLDHGYNDLPSTWLHAHVVMYANGKRALIVIVDGKFRAPPDAPAQAAKRRTA